jgi:hypothetical protein
LLILTVQEIVVIVDVVAVAGVVASVVEINTGVFVVVGKVDGVISEVQGSCCCSYWGEGESTQCNQMTHGGMGVSKV